MKTTVLGFACVILCSMAIAPLLVETDQISRQAADAAPAAANSACVQPIERLPAGPGELRSHRASDACLPAAGLRVAAAR